LADRKVRRPGRTGPESIAHAALGLFGLIATGVTAIAVIESYSNLLAFARTYGLADWRAALAPAAADSFILMGELLLFAAILLHWQGWPPYALGAGMAVWGFALSVGGNVWHAPQATAVDRAVAAIWPVTATAGLAGALIIIKRLMSARVPAAADSAAGPAVPREPQTRSVPVRAARGPGLAAARDDAELVLARELAATAPPWPSDRKLGESSGLGRRRAARALELARTMGNGHGGD